MQCKKHPDRQAEHFCRSCGIPLCEDCSEETKPGEYYCFQCAMLLSVSEVGISLKDKRKKAFEKKAETKKKWGPFRYFTITSSVLLLIMWGVIIFGGQEASVRTGDFAKDERGFLFMVNGALKRYAHYEGNKYPEQLSDLIPKYLSLGEEDLIHLEILSYQRVPNAGYRLSLANPKPGTMNIVISPKGIQY